MPKFRISLNSEIGVILIAELLFWKMGALRYFSSPTKLLTFRKRLPVSILSL